MYPIGFSFLEHKITMSNFPKITTDDLRLLCPVIGDRIRLEEVQRSMNMEKTGVPHKLITDVSEDAKVILSFI